MFTAQTISCVAPLVNFFFPCMDSSNIFASKQARGARAAEHKHGAALRRWMTRMVKAGRAATNTDKKAEGVQLVQDPAVYVQASAGMYAAPPSNKSKSDALQHAAANAAVRFLTSNTDGATPAAMLATLVDACSHPDHRAHVRTVLLDTYALEPQPYVPTQSFSAPTLHWAQARDAATRVFMDRTNRIVVKVYKLSEILKKALTSVRTERNLMPVVDLGNDLVLSYHLVALVSDYARVATPHFALLLDYFVAPELAPDPVGVVVTRPDGAGSKARVTDVSFVPGSLAQYVVVERADMTLGAFLDGEGLTLPLLRAVLFQAFFSLDAAWTLLGYLHYDFHAGNIMVRMLSNELDSPFIGRAWAYKRVGDAAYYYLRVSDHNNVFVEIIDAGRSRMFVPADDGMATVRTGPRHLVGYPMLPSVGVFVDGARADRSWDVRRLALDLLLFTNPAHLVARIHEGRVPGKERANDDNADLLLKFKHFVITALGGVPVLTAALHLVAERLTSAKRTQPRTQRIAFWNAMDTAIKVLSATAEPDALFDAVQHVVRKHPVSNVFDDVIEPLFFNTLVAVPRPVTVPPPPSDLSAGSCLAHPFFAALRANGYASPDEMAGALLTGFVDSDDVLFNPYTGAAADPMDISALRLDASTEAGQLRAPSEKPLCAFCGDVAAGIDAETNSTYCGADCMLAALNALNV